MKANQKELDLKEILSDFSNIKKADWLVASAVDDIYNLEDSSGE